jgi:hypothetical protein
MRRVSKKLGVKKIFPGWPENAKVTSIKIGKRIWVKGDNGTHWQNLLISGKMEEKDKVYRFTCCFSFPCYLVLIGDEVEM